MERLLNVKEIAQLLNFKKGTIYEWVSSGFIPYMKVGRGVRFNQGEVLKWLEKRQRCGRVNRIPNIELTTRRN